MKKYLLSITIFFLISISYSQAPEIYFDMATEKYNRGDYQGAIQELNKLLEILPNSGAY